jgi:hypothetical protein
MKYISVIGANYIEGLKLQIEFDDRKKKTIDFSCFFKSHPHPQYNKYANPEYFKKFKIENGNIVWGKNWDMIFPVIDLYKGKI